MPERKSLIFWIVLIVLIIAGFGIFLLIKRKPQPEQLQPATTTTTTTTEENLSNIDPSEVDSAVKENFNLAKEKAQQWYPDAALVYAQVKLTSLALDEGTEIYVFDSPSTPNLHFTFTLSQKSKRYIRAMIPAEDYLGADLLPIDTKYWKLNYVSALQIAEKEGGRDIREKYLEWTIELNLKRAEPQNWLFWIVDYKTKEGETLSIKINPYSGEVVEGT